MIDSNRPYLSTRKKVDPSRVPRGERQGLSVLKEADVNHIRATYARGATTMKCLAVAMKVSEKTIWDILTRKTWTHLK